MGMMALKRHTAEKNNTMYNYSFFDSVTDFQDFVEREVGNLSVWNEDVWKGTIRETQEAILNGSDWYGTPIVQNVTELSEHNNFSGMHLVRTIQPKIREHLGKYLNHLGDHLLPKPEMAFNDLGLGIFSFDRAATGLHRLEIVNLSTLIDKTKSQLGIELGLTGLRTSSKSVFAFFKNRQTNYPAMRLFIMSGANAIINGDELLYVGLACSELVEFLEQRNIAVEVNILLGSSFESQVCMAVIRVKRFQDASDKNKILLMSSDPRYFRFRGFKGLITLSNHFGLDIPHSLGTISKNAGRDFVDAMNSDGFVFEQSYSLDAAAREVSRIIETYSERIRNGKQAK